MSFHSSLLISFLFITVYVFDLTSKIFSFALKQPLEILIIIRVILFVHLKHLSSQDVRFLLDVEFLTSNFSSFAFLRWVFLHSPGCPRLCRPGWPWTDPPASASGVWVLIKGVRHHIHYHTINTFKHILFIILLLTGTYCCCYFSICFFERNLLFF